MDNTYNIDFIARCIAGHNKTVIKSIIAKLNENIDIINAKLKEHSDALELAVLGIKYRGAVDYYADLPLDTEIGDAYTVKYSGDSGTTPDGTEYVWGNVGGSEQWIDFSKDSYTKAEVNALLTGLQTILSATNKLNPAYIDYDSTHRAVSDTEKAAWNSKQSALTAEQLAAVNSGIDSTKVEQIETNKNNISLLTPTTYYHETTFAASNTWTDTTLTFTIPANTVYYFAASISWSSGQPTAICISTSSTTSGVQSSNCIASSDVAGNIVTCFGQMTKTNNTDVTVYVYAKNASVTGVSPVRLTAFRIS